MLNLSCIGGHISSMYILVSIKFLASEKIWFFVLFPMLHCSSVMNVLFLFYQQQKLKISTGSSNNHSCDITIQSAQRFLRSRFLEKI